MNSQLKFAKYFWIACHNILFQNHDNELFISGCNSCRKCGTGFSANLFFDPKNLNIKLDEDEYVSAFKSYPMDIFIYTNKRLFAPFSDKSSAYNFGDMFFYYNRARITYSLDVDNHTQLLSLSKFSFETDHITGASIVSSSNIPEKLSEQNTIPGGSVVDEHNFAPVSYANPLDAFDAITITVSSASAKQKWHLLESTEFDRLTKIQKLEYIENARKQIDKAFGSGLDWIKDEEKLARVLAQIEAPILDDKPAVASSELDSHTHMEDSIVLMKKSPKPLDVRYNVRGIVFGLSRVIYQIDDKFVVEVVNTTSEPKVPRKMNFDLMPLARIKLSANCFKICEKCMPVYEEAIFTQYFLYLNLGKIKRKKHFVYYHMFIFPTGGSHPSVEYLQCKTNFKLNPEIIRWNKHDNFLYYNVDGTLWYYDTTCKTFVLCTHKTRSIISMTSSGNCGIFSIEKIKSESDVFAGLTSKKLFSTSFTYDDIVSIYETDYENSKQLIVMYERPHKKAAYLSGLKRITNDTNVVYVNVTGLKWWGQHNSRSVMFICSGKLHVLVNSVNIGRPCFLKRLYYRQFDLPVSEQLITNITLDQIITLFVVQSDRTFMYYSFSCIGFDLIFNRQIITETPELLCESRKQDKDNIVDPNMVFKPYYHTEAGLTYKGTYEITQSPFNTLVNIAARCDKRNYLEIDIIKSSSHSRGYGAGATQDFLTRALTEFRETYLIQHNYLASFKTSIGPVGTHHPSLIGKALVVALNNIQTHLSFRLPLALLSALKCRRLTLEELEYFAAQEDPLALMNLQEIRDNPEALNEIGFSDYETGLRSICHFNPPVGKEAFIISIAHGFLQNLFFCDVTLMNIPTIDEFISGKYKIDAHAFIKKINFCCVPTNYQQSIQKMILDLSPDELKTLLVNWSGNPIFNNYYYYQIDSRHGDSIYFSTCGRNISINQDIFKQPEEIGMELIKVALTVKCDVIRDS